MNDWSSAQFVMVDKDVPSRGIEVKEHHRVPWPKMVLGRGDLSEPSEGPALFGLS